MTTIKTYSPEELDKIGARLEEQDAAGDPALGDR